MWGHYINNEIKRRIILKKYQKVLAYYIQTREFRKTKCVFYKEDTYVQNGFLGITVSSEQVGWAVTNPKYELERASRKDLWGVRLFDKAETAEDRRMFRTNRRLNQRKRTEYIILEIFSMRK